MFGESNRLMVFVSMNSDVSDGWEREGDNQVYFARYAGPGYPLGVDVIFCVSRFDALRERVDDSRVPPPRRRP